MPTYHHRASVLIVDPDPVSVTALAAVFDSQGYECYCARSEQAAVKAITQTPIDLIVWDVSDSAEAAIGQIGLLRQDHAEALADVPIFVIADSGCAGLELQIDAIAPARCLFKPLDPNALLDLADQSLWVPHVIRGHHLAKSKASRGKGMRL